MSKKQRRNYQNKYFLSNKNDCIVHIFFTLIYHVFVLSELFRRFKKKKETRLAVERLELEEETTVSLQVEHRVSHIGLSRIALMQKLYWP